MKIRPVGTEIFHAELRELFLKRRTKHFILKVMRKIKPNNLTLSYLQYSSVWEHKREILFCMVGCTVSYNPQNVLFVLNFRQTIVFRLVIFSLGNYNRGIIFSTNVLLLTRYVQFNIINSANGLLTLLC
jgi:hypothetical protein